MGVETFKWLWETGTSFDDDEILEIARNWGIKASNFTQLLYEVCKHAQTNDFEDHNPDNFPTFPEYEITGTDMDV